MLVGWKVLSRGRWSCWIKGKRGKAVHYPKNKWARPHKGNGPLAVFTSEETASIWAHSRKFDYNLNIHKCYYKPSKKTFLWRLLRGGNVKKRSHLPDGTALATAVKTLE